MRIRIFAVSAALLVSALGVAPRAAQAQTRTWVGMVSDSQCGGNHGSEVDVKECTVKCIREGYKYILATDNGVNTVAIANQDFPGLEKFAGDTVKVTGEFNNGAIVISKIELQ
jgi:hypothetical protein